MIGSGSNRGIRSGNKRMLHHTVSVWVIGAGLILALGATPTWAGEKHHGGKHHRGHHGVFAPHSTFDHSRHGRGRHHKHHHRRHRPTIHFGYHDAGRYGSYFHYGVRYGPFAADLGHYQAHQAYPPRPARVIRKVYVPTTVIIDRRDRPRRADPYDDAPHTAKADTFHLSMYNRGWLNLAEGDPYQAKCLFTEQAERYPDHGLPKVGYALASAQLGDLGRGVWAMRRALRIDPQALMDVDLNHRLRSVVTTLIHDYHRGATTSSHARRDHAFMIASLELLLGDHAAARAAVTRATRAGDRHISTLNLKDLIAYTQEGRYRDTDPSTMDRDDRHRAQPGRSKPDSYD